ncbi:MAG TPA: tetratricopeptide repeat protein, partial [Nitrospiria bacterium]
MNRPLKENPDVQNRARMRAAAAALAVLWIGQSGCSVYRQPEAMDAQRMNTVVTEVLEDQSAARAGDYTLRALGEHESGIFDDPGEKSERNAAMMHQLADLFLNLEVRVYRQQVRQYNQKLRRLRSDEPPQRPALPPIDHSRSRKVYEKLLTLYPDRPENDRVQYELARIYDDLGRTEEAMASLQKLADRYPSSPLRQEAIFRLAEAYYDLNRYRQAKAMYQKVVNAPDAQDTELSEMALYKLGWTYLGLREHENAIATFVRLVDRKRVTKENGRPELDPRALSAAEWDRVLEVIRGLALAFSYLGPPAKIHDYFEKSGHRNYEDLIYRKMGDLYMAQKRVQDAVGAYEAFIKAYPLHEESPVVQTEIIEAYQRLNLVDPANRARIQFVDRFGEDSHWYQNAAAGAREKVRPLHRTLVGELALFYHSEAQRTRRPQDYEKALNWYRRYLKTFPKEPDAARINFLLAEGLYELGRYPEAAEEYERTAYRYPLHPDSAEAGYAAIVTAEKMMSTGRQAPKTGPLALKLAQNCRRFSEVFSNDPRARDVLWKGVETYYGAGKFQEARTMASAIVKAALPTDETSHKAQRMIAGSYLEERAYEPAAAAYRHLVRTGGRLPDEEKLKRLWASALYKEGEALKNAGKLREAQTEFMRVHAEVPGSEAAPVALFDAGSVALLRDRLDEALQLFQIQLQRYPDHPLSQKIPETLLEVERTFLAVGKIQAAEALTEKIKALQTPSKTDLAYRAQRMIADRYFEERAYELAAAGYRRLAQDEISSKNQEREELKRLWASSLYKQAEGLRTAGKLAEAQAGFLKVHAERPESEVAPVALFDAGGAALARNDPDGATEAFAILLREYSSSTYAVHAAIQV